MKLFTKLPEQFTRKGMTFVRSKYTLEGAIKNNLYYRVVGVQPTKERGKRGKKPKLYIFIKLA